MNLISHPRNFPGTPETDHVFICLHKHIAHVELLGFKGKVKWTQDEKGLTVQLPEQKPCEHAIALKIAT